VRASDERLAEVASLYYDQGLRQSEIAERLVLAEATGKPMWDGCSASSPCATGCKRWCTPTSTGWCVPGPGPEEAAKP